MGKTVQIKEIDLAQEAEVNGAEALVKSLVTEGVETLFGYPGGANMPIYDMLYKYEAQEQIKHYMGRHEQGAIHAAQGFARASGKVGVVLATSGPGATNLITGLADAMIDSTPLVCITGQVPFGLLGTDAFQEVDITGISVPVTKWSYQITKASEIAEVMARAFYIARSGRPGPVLIDITKSAQFEMIEYQYEPCSYVRSYIPKPHLQPAQVKRAAELINQAQKPLVIWGQGIILSEAEKELDQFLNRTGIPAASTLLGLSALPSDHPNYVGMVGMHGNYAPNALTNEADLIVAIGMRFDDRVTGDISKYGVKAQVIHIELDESEINKNIKADVAVHADAKEALQALNKEVEINSHKLWKAEFDRLYHIEVEQVIDPECSPGQDKLMMGEVVSLIADTCEGEAIIVSDVGQHQMKAARYSKFNNTRTHITSGGLGTMGFCLPAAIGAKLGAPEKEVIAIIGDGGFQMTAEEMGMILEHEIPVKIVVLNNEYLGMVRQWQQLFFEKRYASTALKNPDFIKLAEAYEISAVRVSERSELASSIKAMLDSKKACFVEFMVAKEENVFPMVPSGASVSDIRLQ